MKLRAVPYLIFFTAFPACVSRPIRDIEAREQEALKKIIEQSRFTEDHLTKKIGELKIMSDETSGRLSTWEGRLKGIDREATDRILAWERAQVALAEDRVNEHLSQRVDGLDQSIRAVGAENAAARLKSFLDMYHKMVSVLYPTVQLAGEETVGSGIIIYSRPAAGGTEGFILTACHVVRNMQSEGANPAALRIFLYSKGGMRREATGSLLAQDDGIDIAVIRIVVDGDLPEPVRFISQEKFACIQVFTPVYTVGCPLGNDPIPTAGEVSSTASAVGSESYWMINAPAYFGNSGGGVFLAETGELIGLYSKIYTHGRGRPTVISHMGLVTPIDRILEFLDRSGFGFLFRAGSTYQAPAESQPAESRPVESQTIDLTPASQPILSASQNRER